MRRARRAALLGAGFVVVLFACTGEDPLVFPSNEADAGAGPSGSADASGALELDAGADPPAEAGEPDAPEDGDAGVADASPPVWVDPVDAGAGTTIRVGYVGSCELRLVSRSLGGYPPSAALVLVKDDGPSSTCDEPKGERTLVQGYGNVKGDVLVRLGASPAIVVAYSAKLTPAGQSPSVLSMKQIDPWSGTDMRVAQMKTKTVMGEPMHPSLEFSSLFFGDNTDADMGTVRLKGTGSFPGETGTGTYFLATYVHFIGTTSQSDLAADSCVRTDN